MQISFPKINIKSVKQYHSAIKPMPYDSVSFSAKKPKEIPAAYEPYIPTIKAAISECIENGENPSMFDIRMKTKIATHICDELIHSSPELNELWRQIHRPIVRTSYSESDIKNQKQQIKQILNDVKSQGGTITKAEISARLGLPEWVVTSRIRDGKMKSLWNEVAEYRTHIYSQEEINSRRQRLMTALENAKADGEKLSLTILSKRYMLTSQEIYTTINSDAKLKKLWDEVKTR